MAEKLASRSPHVVPCVVHCPGEVDTYRFPQPRTSHFPQHLDLHVLPRPRAALGTAVRAAAAETSLVNPPGRRSLLTSRAAESRANALQVDGPVATVRNAGPVTVTPVGLLAIRWMGLWPSSAMVVAPELLERKWHWMGTRSTTTMIAICSAFRRHRKEAH